MAVLKYRDPDGTWHTLTGPRGDQGPPGPAGPDGTPGNTLTPEQINMLYLRLDGGNSMEGTLNAGGQQITGAAAGVADTDAITVAQITNINRSPVQAAATPPAPRAAGDLWIDTSAPILEWDTTWTPLPLENGWTPWDTGAHSQPAYRKLMGDLIEIRGALKHTNPTQTGPIATLPEGYRVAAAGKAQLIIHTTGGWASLDILNTGTLSLSKYDGPATASYVSLGGIVYHAEA